MGEFSRRDTLKTLGATALVTAAPTLLLPSRAWGAYDVKPEKGASIRMMRWRRFIQGDEDQWLANTARFTKLTGVKVRVDNEGFEDIRPKAAMAANVGSGPDIVLGWMDDPHLFRNRLLDLTDLAEYLGDKYGGWYPTARRYGTINSGSEKGHWIGLPLGAGGALLNYRMSRVKEAGFETFPTDFDINETPPAKCVVPTHFTGPNQSPRLAINTLGSPHGHSTCTARTSSARLAGASRSRVRATARPRCLELIPQTTMIARAC